MAAVVLALMGCRGPTPVHHGDYERHEGDGCGYQPSECVDADTLWECRDRAWVIVDCDEVCAEHGGAVGCLAGDVVGESARCWCASFDPQCVPGAVMCESEHDVRLCGAETLQYEVIGCDSVCDALKPPRRSLGCDSFLHGGGCRCTLEGTPCHGDAVPHCEYDGLVRCIDGTWFIESCGEVCDTGICDPFGDEEAACVCEAP